MTTETDPKVIRLKTGEPDDPVNHELVEHLEGWLEDAKSGNLRSIVYGAVFKDGLVRTGHFGMPGDLHFMVSAAGLAAHKLKTFTLSCLSTKER